jgi:hypothetical protein
MVDAIPKIFHHTFLLTDASQMTCTTCLFSPILHVRELSLANESNSFESSLIDTLSRVLFYLIGFYFLHLCFYAMFFIFRACFLFFKWH